MTTATVGLSWRNWAGNQTSVAAAVARPTSPDEVAEVVRNVRAAGGTVSGIVVALDRQEIASAQDRRSAAQAVAAESGVPVVAVAGLGDLLAFAAGNDKLAAYREPLQAYRARYGCQPTG